MQHHQYLLCCSVLPYKNMNIFKSLEAVYDGASKYIDDVKNNSQQFEDPEFVKNANSKSMQKISNHKEDIADMTKKSLEKLHSLKSSTATFQTTMTDFHKAVSEILPTLKSNFPGALDETDDVSPNNDKESCPASIKEFNEDEFLEQLKKDLEGKGAFDLPGAEFIPASAKKAVSNEISELCESNDFDAMVRKAEEIIKELSEQTSLWNANLEKASRLLSSSNDSENLNMATNTKKTEGSSLSNPLDKQMERVCSSIENQRSAQDRYQSSDSGTQSILKSSSRFVSNKQHNFRARVTFSLSEEHIEEVGRAAVLPKRSSVAKSLSHTLKENKPSKLPLRKPPESDRKQ